MVIKFETFPYAQYGMAEGTGRTVNPNSFTVQDEAASRRARCRLRLRKSFYRTLITIDRVALHDVPVFPSDFT